MNCPKDLNSFLLGEPLFENTFPDNECEEKKFYGDCFHCFATSIRKRDKQLINEVLINEVLDEIKTEIEDTGAYEQEVNGATEFLKGITYCLNIIDKHKAKSEE